MAELPILKSTIDELNAWRCLLAGKNGVRRVGCAKIGVETRAESQKRIGGLPGGNQIDALEGAMRT